MEDQTAVFVLQLLKNLQILTSSDLELGHPDVSLSIKLYKDNSPTQQYIYIYTHTHTHTHTHIYIYIYMFMLAHCSVIYTRVLVLSCAPASVVHGQEAVIYNSEQSLLFNLLKPSGNFTYRQV
jgi:hypothetical protein